MIGNRHWRHQEVDFLIHSASGPILYNPSTFRTFRTWRSLAEACWTTARIIIILGIDDSIEITKFAAWWCTVGFVGATERRLTSLDTNNVLMATTTWTSILAAQQIAHLACLSFVIILKEDLIYLFFHVEFFNM